MHRRIRYAVVGQGYISQIAVLPAFKHARRNSELAALVSDDPRKLAELSRRYGVDATWGYDEYEECLRSGDVDAVFIALPNHLHCEYVIRAARAGVHVLCEKPMAVTEDECRRMIAACERAGVLLMIAYRLHFDPVNLRAVEIAQSGDLGDLRIFDSVFTMQVRDEDNIRLRRRKGGGTLYDIGIYCINAARYLFRDEPTQVAAMSANNGERRFAEVDEMTTAILRFPRERLATFTSSFGAADHASYRLVGTEGVLELDAAYDYAEKMTLRTTIDERSRERTYRPHDQFAAELLEFSDCILEGREPEPSGEEGLADVRVIRALEHAAWTGRVVDLAPFHKGRRPEPRQAIRRPPVDEPELVNVEPPSES